MSALNCLALATPANDTFVPSAYVVLFVAALLQLSPILPTLLLP